MTSTAKSLTVSQVVSGPPDADVGLEFGGPDGFKILSCAGLMYAPQVGDNVLVDYLGDRPYVVRCLTPGRTWIPPQLALGISNGTPSDPNAVPTSSIYVKDGAIYAVRATPVTPPAVNKLEVAPVASCTWDPSNNWRTDDTMPRQGSFGSGTNKGLWFYPQDKLAQLAGKTGVTGRAKIRRADRGGDPSGPIQLHVGYHPHPTQPGSEPTVANIVAPTGARPGRTSLVDFALDPATVAAFVAGTAKGLAIADSTTSDYLIALGPAQDAASGVLTFTWSS